LVKVGGGGGDGGGGRGGGGVVGGGGGGGGGVDGGGSGPSTAERELSAGALMVVDTAQWSFAVAVTVVVDVDGLFLTVAAATACPAFRLSRNNRSSELPIRRTHVSPLLDDTVVAVADDEGVC